MKFTVIREQWFRGQGSSESRLIRKTDGKMCCVGFFCQAEGFPLEQLDGITTYAKLTNNKSDKFENPIDASIYTINDSVYTTDEYKEATLKKAFLDLGDEVDFV